MRAFLVVAAVVLAACGTGPNPGGPNPPGADGGTVASPDGGTVVSPDGGTPPACTEGDTKACTGNATGNCDPGARTCTGGTWGPCDGRTQPVPGLCDVPSCADGENPGCACRVGTSQECYPGAPATLGHGPCVKGFQPCGAIAGGSKWDDCVGAVPPQADDCSDRNLDCDDKPPAAAACACTNGQTRPCGGTSGGSCLLGTQTCAGAKWGACAGAVQPARGDCTLVSCTGGPNPGCECVVGKSEPCYTGMDGTRDVGTCKGGTRTCSELGRWGACLGESRPLPSCDIASCTGQPLSTCE